MFISSSLTDSNLLINVCLDYVRVQPALGLNSIQHIKAERNENWGLR